MALKFQKIKINKITHETADAISIHFQNPDRSIYHYIPGQYLTLKIDINGKNYNRAYSLCANPNDADNLIVTVKRMEGGLASNHLNATIKEGMEMEVLPPMGNFTATMDAGHQNHYVLIGAGSGITPLMSILRTALQQEPQSKITLVYGNKSLDSIIFKNDLETLQNQYPERLQLIHTLTRVGDEWQGRRGRLHQALVKEIVTTDVKDFGLKKQFYICGPSGMIEQASLALKEIGFSKEQVHEEHFTAALSHPMEDEKPQEEASDKVIERQVTIILDGVEKVVTVTPSNSILEAGLDNDLDPPYACMIGSCCTCKAKLVSGKVVMDDREGLTDAEIRDGYVLTCQSHPLTADVVVNYDE
ncbi:MAG: ferredoxin--NADP reductase [Bacteroidetes bacterium]|nr:ferredoxin--NADP reductase [Bacteroidota bacterium]